MEIIQLYGPDNHKDSFMDIRPIWKRNNREPIWGCPKELCHVRLAGMVVRLASTQYAKAVEAEPEKDFPLPGKLVARLSDKTEITGIIRLPKNDELGPLPQNLN